MMNSSIEQQYVKDNFSEYRLLGELRGSSAAKLFILEKNHEKIVLKIAGTKGIDNGNEKLKDEIIFLEHQNKGGNNKFIQVIDCHLEGEMIWYTMSYYDDYISLKQVIEDYKSGNFNIIRTITGYMFREFYTKSQCSSTKDIGFEANVTRVKSRLDKTCMYNEEMSKLVNARNVYINGSIYMNYNTAIEFLSNHYSHILMYDNHSLVHKDLSIENVLVKPDLQDFMLIDPRGPSNLVGDYMYDLAKIAYTLNGFTQIKQGEFFLNISQYDKYSFKINETASSKYLPYQTYFYQLLDEFIPNTHDGDIFWKHRLLFTVSCHYLSNVPAFLENKSGDDKAVALYLQGIIFLNELLSKLSQEEKSLAY